MSKLTLLCIAAFVVSALEAFNFMGISLPQVIGIPLYLLFIFGIGHETLILGSKALFQLNFKSIKLLMLIAVVGAFALGKYEEAAVVIVLYTLAEELEGYGFKESKNAIDSLVNKLPKKARLKASGKLVPIAELNIGDVILIKSHEAIPADAEVIDGNSAVDESSITGEPLPKEKEAGDLIFAGTVNIQGALEAKVTKKSENSTIARIKQLTSEALERKGNALKFIDKFAGIYTPLILLLSLGLTLIPWLVFGADFKTWFLEALTLLVISCPCALVISTPMSVYSAVGKASKMGALIKGGLYLEALGNTKHAFFDKTRTLTYGKPHVTDIEAFNGYSADDVLACAAGMELFSAHPLSESIVEEAKKRGVDPHETKNFETVVGKGVKAECQVCKTGHRCLGKMPFVSEEHPLHEQFQERVYELQSQGKTVVVLGADEGAIGLIALEDTLREDAAPTIQTLTTMGITSYMLTGDQKISADKVAQSVGIEKVYSELLPEDKVQKISEQGTQTLMCGDGINDAPALAAASCSVAFSDLSSEAAIESASVIILNERLEMIPQMIKLGRRAKSIIRFNTVVAIAIKILFIILALTGLSNLAGAIFADVGVTLLVVMNSLRLMR